MPQRYLLIALLCAHAGFGQIGENLLRGMQYRLVGPFRGGRVLAVTGIPGDPQTYYFGAAAGGVWKSVDGGAHWTPQFDKQDIASVGSIAVAPSDPNILYVGSGEGCLRGNISYGDGVYRSNDAGKTWTNLGLKDTRHIPRVIIDPRNPDVVLVAALGHAFGPNTERGVFRTTDGGKTWTKVLYIDDHTGAIDLAYATHPIRTSSSRPCTRCARQPWAFSSGGPGSGLYRSNDGGVTWKNLTGNGLPAGVLGRIGVSVSGRRSRARLRPDRSREGRPVPLRRRRREVGAHQRGRTLSPARLVFQPHVCRPQQRRHRVRAQHRHVPLHRRGQDLHPAARAARRSPRPVDRPHQSAAHDQRRRRRRHDLHRWRQELDAAV